MPPLIMYSLSDCPTCAAARTEMSEQGIAFEERLVDSEPRWQADVVRLTRQRTVPVFVKGDEIVVGFHGEKG